MKKILLLLLLPFTIFAQKEVVVNIATDYWPSETRWVLHLDSLGGPVINEVNYGYYTQANTAHSDTFYIADTITNVTWVIYDSYGDGMNGSYSVIVCGNTIIDVPSPNFSNGWYYNRSIPTCLANPPPAGNCQPALLHINLDQYQSETSWNIKDSNGTIIESGGPYGGMVDYQSFSVPMCIPVGQLTFTMYDTYGDGLAGSMWGGQDGSYYLTQCNDTLVYGNVANFGYDTTHVFVSDSCPPIYGCMDPLYLQFNPLADTNDSSCVDLVVFGCTDSTMFNYDSLANRMSLIPNCDYTLTLYDLMGDGWVGSYLEVTQDTTVTQYVLTAGFSQDFNINLNAPNPVSFKFYVTQQAQLTTAHCGFKLTNPLGNVIIEIAAPFIQPLFTYTTLTYCGNLCVDKVFGCLDPLAVNYDTLANTEDSTCYYVPGCTNSSYLEYYTQGFVADFNDGSCITPAVWGCIDSTAFNYNLSANIDNGGCIPVILGCMQPLAFNYNSLANTSDTCIAFLYGCTDGSMFNYNPLANADDGSCIAYIFGCTDSTMFNYNPLANADNNSCTPFIFGCTDPSMLNYNPLSNTEDFSCIPFIYGCMDSTALNYDSLANTDNESCITIVEGCMDQSAFNYDIDANVHDSISCLFDASCITGPGNPYWLNNPCYAWVIDVDDYCCENEWDDICQLTYNYCEGTYIGDIPARMNAGKKVVSITDLLGRPAKEGNNKLLFYIYDDGSVEKKINNNKNN